MVKNLIFTIAFVFILGAFSSISAQTKAVKTNTAKTELKFLEDISVESASVPASIDLTSKASLLKVEPAFASRKESALVETSSGPLEKAKALQFKYSLLLDIEVELVNLNLFKVIDDWFGIRYLYGGTSKSGIDCSALMQVFFTALYGISLPRTARDQFHFTRRISRTELQEGDLVFFNTRGGISHVGMYLSNNKFVHASSNGVAISSLYDPYYSRKFIGVGRIEKIQNQPSLVSLSPKP